MYAIKKRSNNPFIRFLLTITMTTLGACAVTSVDPIAPSREITQLCIDHNPDAGANYDEEIGKMLSEMGLKSRMTGGSFPGECPHRLLTRISWSDTLIPYVVTLELEVSENNRPLGDASYFVGQAYRTPERLGSAASKAKPLLEELLEEYKTSIKENNAQ